MDDSDPKKARRVILFSGHLIDAANRPAPRFPPRAASAAAREIGRILSGLKAGAGDIGITQGAAGGDLLFAEGMLARGASLQLYLPFRESSFLKTSVTYQKLKPPSDRWRKRFFAVRNHPRTSLEVITATTGGVPRHADPYERCNLWMLNEAQALAGSRALFICLWDGGQGDGRGGTAHMMRCVQDAGLKSYEIDTRRL
jgi:hypothetical protein